MSDETQAAEDAARDALCVAARDPGSELGHEIDAYRAAVAATVSASTPSRERMQKAAYDRGYVQGEAASRARIEALEAETENSEVTRHRSAVVAATALARIEELETVVRATGALYADLDAQIEQLATWIAENVPGEPSQSQGAVDTAIRIMRATFEGIDAALHELGVPGEGYPAPVANAVEILRAVLAGTGEGAKPQ